MTWKGDWPHRPILATLPWFLSLPALSRVITVILCSGSAKQPRVAAHITQLWEQVSAYSPLPACNAFPTSPSTQRIISSLKLLTRG